MLLDDIVLFTYFQIVLVQIPSSSTRSLNKHKLLCRFSNMSLIPFLQGAITKLLNPVFNPVFKLGHAI